MTWHSRPWVPGHSLMFDIRYQYALHTTSFKEQPIFKNRLIYFYGFQTHRDIKMIPINLVGDGNTGKESKRQGIMRGKNEAKREYLNSRR